MERFWRCPGCGRTKTDKGFWVRQLERCRCGWPIHDYRAVREAEALIIAAERQIRKEGRGE